MARLKVNGPLVRLWPSYSFKVRVAAVAISAGAPPDVIGWTSATLGTATAASTEGTVTLRRDIAVHRSVIFMTSAALLGVLVQAFVPYYAYENGVRVAITSPKAILPNLAAGASEAVTVSITAQRLARTATYSDFMLSVKGSWNGAKVRTLSERLHFRERVIS